MNKKLYFNMIFFIMGTIIVLGTGTIIGINFVKDSRLLASTTMAPSDNQETSQAEPVKAKKNEGSDNEDTAGTYIYKREPLPVISTPKPTPTPTPKLPDLEPGITGTPDTQSPPPDSTKDPEDKETPSTSPTASPTPTPSGNATPGNTATPSGSPAVVGKVRVEVVNCSGKKDLAEIVRQKLEGHGFEVSAGNVDTLKSTGTEIIFRNDNAQAQNVKNYISAGKVSKQPDPNSKYDVTIILGDDYTP